MAQEWTPPIIGHPCWINILATDVPRARQFYVDVFNWTFRQSVPTGHGSDPNSLALFNLGKSCPEGGITKVEYDNFVRTSGRGGVVLYLYVHDLEDCVKRVVKAGGRKLTEVEPESDFGWMQTVEDTEGNTVGIYTMQRKN